MCAKVSNRPLVDPMYRQLTRIPNIPTIYPITQVPASCVWCMHRSLTGCLSLQNWICPRACIQLLQGKAASAEGAEFNSFLAIVS